MKKVSHKKEKVANGYFQDRVWMIVKMIPRGSVATYGAIAKKLGKPGAARAVGNALHKNRSAYIPCHRVVRTDGMVGGFAHGTPLKISLLEKEGVYIKAQKVAPEYILFSLQPKNQAS